MPVPPTPTTVGAVAASVTEAVREQVRDLVEEAKPHLRGWLHAVTAPLALAAGILLVWLSPTGPARIGSAVFATCALVLFSVSATMHRGRWSPRTGRLLTRLDHACIFLLIAGSYTPFAILMLEGSDRVVLLAVAWGGALLGISFRTLWATAPRWVYTPLYIGLGWVSVFFLGDLASYATHGHTIVALIAAGGILYTVGAVVYGTRRPNPFPQWFGFHEIFHAFTVLAFVAHYSAVSLAAYTAR